MSNPGVLQRFLRISEMSSRSELAKKGSSLIGRGGKRRGGGSAAPAQELGRTGLVLPPRVSDGASVHSKPEFKLLAPAMNGWGAGMEVVKAIRNL